MFVLNGNWNRFVTFLREVIWALYRWRCLSGIFESNSFCSFLSRTLLVQFCVKGKTLSLGGMLHMSND